jgi:predicted transcriptional regulator
MKNADELRKILDGGKMPLCLETSFSMLPMASGEMTVREIARLFKITRQSVQDSLQSALKKLRKHPAFSAMLPARSAVAGIARAGEHYENSTLHPLRDSRERLLVTDSPKRRATAGH